MIIPSKREPSDLRGHLRYALRYEALDLLVWKSILDAIDPHAIETWVTEEPTSAYARRCWFLYEFLTDQVLNLEDQKVTNFVDLCAESLQVCGARRISSRHRIWNNLLGNREFCPLIRVTDELKRWLAKDLKSEAERYVDQLDDKLLQRALGYLYLAETKASFAIEKEEPTYERARNFVDALRQASEIPWFNEPQLTEIQNLIVEPRYAESGFRTEQNYIGRSLRSGEEVHYACPRPEDVPSLMKGWREFLFENAQALDPILLASSLGFGFVFIHPYMDGNGRLHRFIIHATLAKRRFVRDGLILPVSAVMLRNPAAYKASLESHSKRIMPFIQYSLDMDGRMSVVGDSLDFYRYWDATPSTEYLFSAVSDAIMVELDRELKVLETFDRVRAAVIEVVDMPDRKADTLANLLCQNSYRLAKSKRRLFPELTDEEIARMEELARTSVVGDASQEGLPFDNP